MSVATGIRHTGVVGGEGRFTFTALARPLLRRIWRRDLALPAARFAD
ncbi:MAG: hypothetical protein ACE5GB_13685 [Acidimicrobiales bacterium]